MWRKKKNAPFKGRHTGSTSKNEHNEKKKDGSVICYECKKSGHFKSECFDLEKSKRNVTLPIKDKNNVLMSMWEDLDCLE